MVEKETSEHFDNVASVWENKVWVNKGEFDEKILQIASLTGEEIALDIGIGTGALAKRMNVKEMYGLDISSGMLEKCSSIPRQNLVIGSGEKAPFLDETFDLVTARNLLKHVNDIPRLLNEMNRLLKKNGKILIIESTPFTREQCDIPTMAMRVVEPYHPRFFSKDELAEMIRNAGFEIETHGLEVMKQKWLQRWAQAKNASPEQVDRIFQIFKDAPEFFRQEQHVEIFEDEKEILNDFPWSIVLAVKKEPNQITTDLSGSEQ